MSFTETEELTDEQIADLKAAAGESEKVKAQVEAMQRENAILRAGVDTSTPVGKMFLDAYKGDLDTDAIVAAATEVGAVKTETPEETTQDQQLSDERLALGADSPAVPEKPDVDPRVTAAKDYREAVAGGQARDTAFRKWLEPMVAAANVGDQRAVYNHERWVAEQGGYDD